MHIKHATQNTPYSTICKYLQKNSFTVYLLQFRRFWWMVLDLQKLFLLLWLKNVHKTRNPKHPLFNYMQISSEKQLYPNSFTVYLLQFWRFWEMVLDLQKLFLLLRLKNAHKTRNPKHPLFNYMQISSEKQFYSLPFTVLTILRDGFGSPEAVLITSIKKCT